MIVDLNQMQYSRAIELIHWCVDHQIDYPNAVKLVEALSISPVPDVTWELDIPEQYVTWMLMKWA